jgi:hypothetical protein
MLHEEDPQDEQQPREDDPLYDLRTHVTDATLAADFLRRTDGEDAVHKRVHDHLKRAHESLRDDIDTLNDSLTDDTEP